MWEETLSRDYFREFKGRGVIVAGGASGIGAALVDAFSWLGAEVAILDRNRNSAESLAARLKQRDGSDVFAFGADLAVESERIQAVSAACGAVKNLSAFVSTLGLDGRVNFDELTQAQAEQSMRVNFFAPFFAARDVLPALRAAGGGAICLFTSRHGSEIFEPDIASYGTAKAALDSGIRRLAIKAGEGNMPDNIVRVFGFCPGWVQTEAQRERFSPQQFTEAAREQLVPQGMMPQDIVPAVIFALSRYAALLSGTIVRFDGGEGQIKQGAVAVGSRKT